MNRLTRTPRWQSDPNSIPAFIQDLCGLISVALLVAAAALALP